MHRSHVETILDLRGPAGRLEAILNTGGEAAPYAALVCHPHPPSGGTMHTKAVYHAMKAFSHFGLPVLRFNFRSAGRSEGIHDYGRGEQDDVRAALDWLTARFNKPILVAGFSFGAYVSLRACCGDPRVSGFVALGLPVLHAGRDYAYHFLARCPQPKLFLSGDHDEFAPVPLLQETIATAADPKDLRIIAGADHFFAGIPASPASKLEAMQSELRSWLASTFHLTSSQS